MNDLIPKSINYDVYCDDSYLGHVHEIRKIEVTNNDILELQWELQSNYGIRGISKSPPIYYIDMILTKLSNPIESLTNCKISFVSIFCSSNIETKLIGSLNLDEINDNFFYHYHFRGESITTENFVSKQIEEKIKDKMIEIVQSKAFEEIKEVVKEQLMEELIPKEEKKLRRKITF